jgi:hypothetical protein
MEANIQKDQAADRKEHQWKISFADMQLLALKFSTIIQLNRKKL